MKLLTAHADFIEFEPKSKALKTAAETPKGKRRFEECLVAFMAVEKRDESDPSSVASAAVREIKGIAAQVKPTQLVLYPWVHLTNAPSSPDVAIKVLDEIKAALEKEFTVAAAPFGYYKAFNISVKGHPLAELSRELSPEGEKGKVAVKEEKFDVDSALHNISKTSLSRSELKENDHRIIGQNLDLFSFYNVAPGMVFWHPKGLVIYNELVDYWRDEHRKAGYVEVSTPQVMSDVLWKVSGHWDHYKENIFMTEYDKRSFAVKPMNCPGGLLVYASRSRSYRELPLRMSELGIVHRVELSGVLGGLFRLIQFTQDDAHLFCTPERLESELEGVIRLVDKFYKKFGLEYRMELSTKPAKAMGSQELWDKAENALKSVLDKTGSKYKINAGDGAFYGPKIDFHIKDSLGRSWQLATLQLDFQMPERFKLTYVGEDGKEYTPIMLHRVVYGALERFIGILLEHTNGNLPPWLAPVQVKIISFSEKNNPAAEKAHKQLFDAGFRVEVDVRTGTVESKVRDAEMQKIPYIIVIGDKEEANGTIAVRTHGQKGVKFGVKLDAFEKQLKDEVETRKM